ncbi:MAG TPA: copper oxidase [Crenotrichaceae bacterium]|nr:copper oxidase [Crenotrichaceae bacterium]
MKSKSSRNIVLLIVVQMVFSASGIAAPDTAIKPKQTVEHSMHHQMQMDMDGMVMNANTDKLPRGCTEISEDVKITVKAGRQYASQMNGIMFTYNQRQWKVKPCSRVHVTFINDDHIRHQFMLHQLPPTIYPPFGMFNIEVTGPGQRSASFIVPNIDKTYLVHCDVAQHTQNGMKAQLVVGKGNEDGDLPSIPGVTPPTWADTYTVKWSSMSYSIAVLSALASILLGVAMWYGLKSLARKR